MKLGVNMFIWSAAFGPSNFDLLPRIKEAGFDGIEVPLFDPAAFKAAEIRKAAEAHALDVTVCSIIPNGLNLVSDDAALRRKTQQHLRDAIARTAEVGARLMDGPLYAPVGYLPGRRRTADEWQWAIEGYQSTTDALEAHDVTLAIEPLNRFETFFLTTAADTAAMCEAVNHPRVGVAFDTFHANIEEKNIADACRRIGRHLKHVQISENDRGTPGSGHVAFGELLSALREMHYDQWLTIESFGPNLGDFSSAVCIWRDIEPRTESIAFDGLQYLRQMLGAAR
jgi:D-psicose/D-tagatose/L-ribulose 3-epimerase